jgi:hypothetical protein
MNKSQEKCKTDLVSVQEIVALDFYLTRTKRRAKRNLAKLYLGLNRSL